MLRLTTSASVAEACESIRTLSRQPATTDAALAALDETVRCRPAYKYS
jgi:hypothetical protein